LLAIGVTIERYYNKQNRLARVILPPQDLTDGNLQLNVIESVVSKVEVEQALETMPKTQDYILAVLDARQKSGDTLNSKSIERGLAVANEVPGVSVTGSLKEGELDGETELILKMYKNQSRQAELLVDNYGSRSTGSERAMVSASFFNPRDLADLFSLTGIHTRGSEYARMAYSLPVGLDGWRMGANLSAMTYEVVTGAVGVVGAAGKAFTQGLDWAYPLLRSTEENISLLFNVDSKKYQNISAQGIELSNYKLDSAAAQISGTLRDISTGTNLNYSGQFTWGRLNLDGSLSQVTDITGARTEGSFGKLRLTASVQQAINELTSFLGNFTFQRASRNLDGIRAYPTGEGSGSEGEVLSFELRQALNESVNIAAFYDWGQIHQQHDPNFPGGPTNNSYILKGVGLSATYVDASGVQLKGIWAQRLGHNPNPTQAGTDQDGTYDRNRYWLQLNVPF
jgi:hemolysin activation/secretion protein